MSGNVITRPGRAVILATAIVPGFEGAQHVPDVAQAADRDGDHDQREEAQPDQQGPRPEGQPAVHAGTLLSAAAGNPPTSRLSGNSSDPPNIARNDKPIDRSPSRSAAILTP